MAFMGMVFVGIALILLGVGAAVIVVLLIVATVLMIKKHKVAATVLYCIAAIPILLGGIVVLRYVHSIRHPQYERYDGQSVTIAQRDIDRMRELLVADDYAGLRALLDRRPALIYYLDTNRVSLLEYGMLNCDIEIMEIAVDHGARFDDPIAYDKLVYACSLDRFFDLDYPYFAYTSATAPDPRFTPGETTEEIIETARFVIDHGAAVSWEDHGQTITFADSVAAWIELDGKVTPEDEALLRLAQDALS